MHNNLPRILFIILSSCLVWCAAYAQNTTEKEHTDSIVITQDDGTVIVLYPADSISVAPDSIHKEVQAEHKILNKAYADSLIQVVPADTVPPAVQLAFKDNIAEKYASDGDLDYVGKQTKSILQQFREWFNNIVRKMLGLDSTIKANQISEIALNIALTLLFLSVIFIVVRLFINYRGRGLLARKDEQTEITVANVEEHIHEADFASMLRETEQQGDTRQSVRLMYLWLLKLLSERGAIEWHNEKTNADYQREITDTNLAAQFRYLSYLYNYIWYGEFAITDTEYLKTRAAFAEHIPIDKQR